METWKTIAPYLINTVAVIFLIAVVLTYFRRKQGRIAWQGFAEKHGLSYQSPDSAAFFSKKIAIAFQDPGEVTGRIEGLPFRLYIAIYGTSKGRRIFTIMAATLSR